MAEDPLDRNSSGPQHGRSAADGSSANMPAPSAVTADAMTLDEPPANGRPLHDVGPGTVIAGRYKLLRQIGYGGFGIVYLADQDRPVRRRVAVKLIKLGMDSEQVLARFDAERQALALLSHPNVAAVYDAGVTDSGRPFFVMEYVPGEPITAFSDRHCFTTRQRLELFLQACEAVQHAHQKAIIHRDLKPSNLLVTLQEGDKPLLKVIDFGVAKATAQRLTEHTLFTEQGQLIGTPEYMSPEQAELNAVDVDTRTDIYSLGVVLYELLTGAVPFDPKTLRRAAFAQIQKIIREQNPPRPSTRLSNLGEAAAEIARHRQIPLASLERELRGDLEWIPLKALRKDRAQRYRTAAEFSEDVRNYLEDKPLTAGPESAAYRARKFLRRNKGLVASVTTLSIILAGASAVSTWQAVRARRAEANAKLSQLEASRQRDQAIAEKQRADDQTETAKAVRDFLQEMLSAGASYRGLGENVTVLEAVRQAVKKLDEGALDAKPLVEGAVRLSVGETLVGIGRHDEAEPNLVKSLALRRSALPPGHPDVAMSLDRLGGMYKDLGLFDKAEPALREAIAIYRAQLPTREWDYSFTLTGLSWVLREQKHLDEAERLDREALAIRRRLRSPSGIAHALGALAKDLDAQGRLEEEEQVLRERFDLWRKVSPANAYAADQVWDLGSVLRKRGKLDEANRLLNESLQTAGEDKTAVRASRLRSRAGLLRAMGRLDEAARDHRESLEIRLKELPKGHPIIAESLVSLAAALRDAGDTNGTVELMKGIGAQYLKDFAERRRGTKDTPDTAVTLILIGSSFEAAGFYEKAEELYRDGLKIRRHLLNEYHPQVAAVLSRLSQLLDRCGRRSEADALWQETVDQRLKKLGSDNAPAQCAAVYLSVVPAMLNADHLDQARAFCEEALGRGPTNLYYLNAVGWRLTVAAELHQRDPALAVKLADRAVALAPEDGAIRNTLGVALYRAGDFKRAATELRVSVQLNAAAPIVSDYLFLAMAYKRMGDEPSAREWYDKAVKMNVKTAQSEEVRQFRAEADATLALSPTAARAPAAAATDSAMQLAVPADVEALIGSGRLDAAEKRLLELHATLQGDARAAVRDRLMRLYAERGKFDDAIKIAAQRVASARKLYRPGHPRFPRVAQYRLDYAELLLQDRQFETAEHVLAEAERECLPDQRQEVTAAYVKLYEASGNREEAANWRAKLGIDAGAATRPHAAATRPAGPPQ